MVAGEETWRKRKGTEGVSTFVIESSEHLVKTFQTNFRQKPLYVGARQAFVSLKTQTRVLHNHCTTDLQQKRGNCCKS